MIQNWLKRTGTKEFLTVPLRVWSIILVIWIIGLAISMPAIWIGFDDDVARITLLVTILGLLVTSTAKLLDLYVKTQPHDRRREQQQLYTTNVQHLGHESESVRLGGIYGLELLAKDSPDWAPKVAEVLCALFRTTTSVDYLEKHGTKALNEMNIILNILTGDEDNPFDPVDFDWRGISLSRVVLDGINLSGAYLPGAYLVKAHLKNANLSKARLMGANLNGAQLCETDLSETELGRTALIEANLNGANLSRADLRGADLRLTRLNKANLTGTKLGGANLLSPNKNQRVSLVGCIFESTDLRHIYWGVFTQGYEDAIEKDRTAERGVNQRRYLINNAVKRELTKEEKEYLVGKENVSKCIWGDIYVLEE